MRVSTSGTRLGAFALAALLLAGCASTSESVPELEEQALYEQARGSLERGHYTSALNELEALDTRFPFGDYAEQTQLDLIYTYYQTDNWEATRAAANRFIRLNPSHPQADYALYMRGLASWQAGRFSLERLRLIDISKRDLGASRDAYTDFRALVERYPDSEYAPDARQRIVYLRNLLAQHELHVADFYLRRGAYLAAVERGRWVVENYPETPATRDALAVMVEGYMGLEMNDRAREVLRTLIDNAPDHERLQGRSFHPKHIEAPAISA